ncbi:MAG: hypothetical protein FJ272_15725, partial [Planctomycetes bacterium]|nr:hypothetical protein [Planctomycetota bacterium]
MAYKPVALCSFAVDYGLWGHEPWGYHLTNVMLHCVSGILLWALGRRLMLGPLAAFSAALIFAVHPVHTEALDWVKNRAELLPTGFGLIALLGFIQCWPPDGRGERGRPWHFLASLMA